MTAIVKGTHKRVIRLRCVFITRHLMAEWCEVVSVIIFRVLHRLHSTHSVPSSLLLLSLSFYWLLNVCEQYVMHSRLTLCFLSCVDSLRSNRIRFSCVHNASIQTERFAFILSGGQWRSRDWKKRSTRGEKKNRTKHTKGHQRQSN